MWFLRRGRAASLEVRGMSQLRVLPALSDELTILRDMREPIERRLLKPAWTCGEKLEIIGVTPIPTLPFVRCTEDGTWFFMADYLADAGLRQDGAIAIPDRELKRLQRFEEAGVSVDFIWVAHELPENWTPEDPLPMFVPDAPRYSELDQRLERIVSTALSASLTAITMPARIATASLDPVILGGIRHADRAVVAWAMLAKWDW